jgi:hypothetical protein
MIWYCLRQVSNEATAMEIPPKNGLRGKDISPNSIISRANILKTTPLDTPSDNVTYSQSSINKLPAVKFSGSGKLSLDAFTQGASSQATIFMVVKLNYAPDSSNYRTIFDSSSSTFAFSIKSDMAQLNAGSAGTSNSSANSFSNSLCELSLDNCLIECDNSLDILISKV